MKITWAGTGAAFAPANTWQCQAVITSDTGKHLLLDCGSDARHSLKQYAGLEAKDIDAVYVSHLHGDHVHGLEWLAFCRYSWSGAPTVKPKLYGVKRLLEKLWSDVLCGTLESIEGKVNTLEDYFDVIPLDLNGSFVWEDMLCQPVQTVHVMNGCALTDSFGLFVTCPYSERTQHNPKVFFTSDTQFCPSQIHAFYKEADLIFHDCETSPFRSSVHAHYDDLCGLGLVTKSKMGLVHYQEASPTFPGSARAKHDGFGHGFVAPGDVFDVNEMF